MTLPVFALVGESFAFAIGRWRDVLHVSMAPLSAILGLDLLNALAQPRTPPWFLAMSLLDLFLSASFLVGLNRLAVLGAPNKPRWFHIPFGRREGVCFLALAASGALSIALGFVAVAAADAASSGSAPAAIPINFLVLAATVCLSLIVSFVAAAIAVDDAANVRECMAAARLLRGSTIRLAAASLLGAVLALLMAAPGLAIASLGAPILRYAGVVLVLPALALGLTALLLLPPLAYRRLAKSPLAPPPPAH